MMAKHKGLIPILLLFCAMVAGGCGWITGGDDLSDSSGTPSALGDSASPSSFSSFSRAGGVYSITSVVPNQGFLPGGENILVNGVFPAIANAVNIYKVYFGANIAPYIPLVPSFTPTQLNVTAPPGDALGFVDVWLYDTIAGMYCAILPNGYQYITSLELISINPDNGPLCLQTPIEVLARLPYAGPNITDVAVAKSMYEVTIDGFQAIYDVTALEALRVNGDGTVTLFMLSPVGASLGLKPGLLIDKSGTEPSVGKIDVYEYTGVEIISVNPNNGFLGANTAIEVVVSLPGALSLTIDESLAGIAIAEGLYEIIIDGVVCDYDVSALSANIIEPDGLNTKFYVLTPPGTTASFEDVIFRDVVRDCLDSTLIDGYEYTSSGSIGTWSAVTIGPNPIGPLKAGELEVSVTITNPIEPDVPDPGDPGVPGFDVFIVPQGGNPADTTHRIALISTDITGNVWTGTNVDDIETGMFGASGLYPDGHAAVYLFSTGDGIIGDDYVSPFTDGGVIIDPVRADRHVTIDTLPPIMFVNGVEQLAVLPLITSTNGGVHTPAGADGLTHPYPIPGAGFRNLSDNFPWSDFGIWDAMIVPPPLNPEGAQIFFNVASISNNSTLLNETLGLSVTVGFVDRDIFSILNKDGTFKYVTGGLDADPFDSGNTYRAPAGFGTVATLLGPISPVTPGEEDKLLGGISNDPQDPGDNYYTDNVDVMARWELQGASTRYPSMSGVSVTYTLSNPIATGYMYTVINESGTFEMAATWTIGEMAIPDEYMRLVTQFAAADRADIYYPRGDDTQPLKKIMTATEDQLDPLQIWWMREVSTDITHDGIPANGVTQTPDFLWEIGTQPRPVLDVTDAVQPLFSYQLWESSVSDDLEEYRNGIYSPVAGFTWTDIGWSTANTFAPTGLAPNKWYLLTVMSIDEAGNAEAWPNDLVITGGLLEVVGTNNKGGNNWRRFYYAEGNDVIDTKVTSINFWHDTDNDGNVDAGEATFGSNLIIPLPLHSTGVLVSAEFIAEVTGGDTGTESVNWTLSTDGAAVAVAYSTIDITDDVLVATLLGDPDRQRAITYVLTAAGNADVNGNNVDDSTPVNIRFTVVPQEKLSEYLKNRKSDSKQVIKEFTRQ